MAGYEQAKTDFIGILSSLNRKFDIIHTKWAEERFFEAKFRTHIPRNNDDFNSLCDEWVELFSNVTSTVWVKKISNTGPKIRFRKQYQCWPQIGKLVQKELLFDARRCKATLDVKVLTDNPQTRRKNKHIRMGLNVVVKINFTHLHTVDTKHPFAFFIHTCEPQAEAPKPIVHSNEKLSQKVAEMVQKGLNSSLKVVNKIEPKSETINPATIQQVKVTTTEPLILQQQQQQEHLHSNQLSLLNMEPMAISQVLPLQNVQGIKLQVQPQLSQLAQVVVTTPQLEMNESLLMCQPTLMFDPTQVIPVTTHHLSPHFVQLHSHNIANQQENYL